MTKFGKILGLAKEEELKKKAAEIEISELRKELAEANHELQLLIEERKQHPSPQELTNKAKLYELILLRYQEYIEQSETKTIPLIKKMVQPSNSHVVSLAETLKNSENPLKTAYEYITIKVVSVPTIQTTFWLTITEMLEHRIATYEDKAILLCSVFKALGGNAKVVIAQMTDGSDRPFVLLEQEGANVLCDPNDKHNFSDFSGTKEEVIGKYSRGGSKIQKLLYEFDDKDYVQYGVE